MTNHNILNPFVPCHALIFLDEQGRSNAYCQRERGHAGEHDKDYSELKPEEKH